MNQTDLPTGRITEIRSQVRDPERVSIFVDEQFRLGLPRKVAVDEGLVVGKELTPADLDRLTGLDETSRATDAGLRLLGFRPRSRRELEDRLKRKGFAESAIEAAIEQLAEWRYIDDDEFARYWVENRATNRPRGKRLMAAELRAKGVPKPVIDSALDDAEIDETAEALELARRRSAQLERLDPQVRRRRLIGFLQRRGFGWDAIRSALDRIDSESES